MKVYSWKMLIGTVIIAGGMLIHKLITFNISHDLYLDVIWIILWCYLLFQGLYISLTKAGYEAEQERIKSAESPPKKKKKNQPVWKFMCIINQLPSCFFSTHTREKKANKQWDTL